MSASASFGFPVHPEPSHLLGSPLFLSERRGSASRHAGPHETYLKCLIRMEVDLFPITMLRRASVEVQEQAGDRVVVGGSNDPCGQLSLGGRCATTALSWSPSRFHRRIPSFSQEFKRALDPPSLTTRFSPSLCVYLSEISNSLSPQGVLTAPAMS